jgi:hypothetical protein
VSVSPQIPGKQLKRMTKQQIYQESNRMGIMMNRIDSQIMKMIRAIIERGQITYGSGVYKLLFSRNYLFIYLNDLINASRVDSLRV